jgi:hypothetical protein
MSLTEIVSNALNTTLDVNRKSDTSLDDIGEFDATESTVYTGIPANVQPRTSEEVFELQGISHRQTHVGYLNRVFNGSSLEFQIDDMVTDNGTGLKHRVIAVQDFRPARQDTYASGHHLRLVLENLGDPRFL